PDLVADGAARTRAARGRTGRPRPVPPGDRGPCPAARQRRELADRRHRGVRAAWHRPLAGPDAHARGVRPPDARQRAGARLAAAVTGGTGQAPAFIRPPTQENTAMMKA